MHIKDYNADHIINDFTHISNVVSCILLFYVTFIMILFLFSNIWIEIYNINI